MKKFLTTFWIIASIASAVHAQDEAEPAEEVRGRSAWFIYTNMPEEMENPVSVMSGEEVIEVTLSKRSPSIPVKIPADGILKLVKKVENPEDPKKTVYQTLAHAAVPDGVNKALIILMPTAKNASGLVFQSKIRDLSKFTAGNSMYLNMTNVKVGVELGENKILIEPGKDVIHSDSNLKEPKNVAVRYSYFHPTKQEWKMLSASTIVLYPTRREICIFSWDEKFQRMDYHGITLTDM